MRLQHSLDVTTLVLVALFAASCSKGTNKPTELSLVAAGAETNITPVSAQKSETVIPAGSLNFVGIEVSHFLQFYAAIANARLDTNQLGELRGRYIALANTNAVTRSEAIRLFDKALYDQAGIVATHPDAGQVVFKFRLSGNEK